jgi:VanZ family protein
MLLIYSMSSLQQLPQTPGPFTDKHWHALEYGGFAVLWARALAGGRWTGLSARVCATAVGASLLYAATDEWHQAYVPGRDSSRWDLLADAVGASAAAAGLYACGIIARSWRGPSLS